MTDSKVNKSYKSFFISFFLILIVLLLVFCLFVFFMNRLLFGNTEFNHNIFKFDINDFYVYNPLSTKISINYHYDNNLNQNEIKFYDRTNNQEIFSVKYDGLSEIPHYRYIQGELIFWFNGIDTYSSSANNVHDVNSKVYSYLFDKKMIIELKNNDSNSVVIDVNKKKSNNYYLVVEKANDINTNGRWKNSKIYVDNNIFQNDSVGYLTNREVRSDIFDDNIIYPAKDGVYILDKNQQKKIYGFTENIDYAYVYSYSDNIILIYNKNITILDSTFEVVMEKKYDTPFKYYYCYFENDEIYFLPPKRDCNQTIMYVNLKNMDLKYTDKIC